MISTDRIKQILDLAEKATQGARIGPLKTEDQSSGYGVYLQHNNNGLEVIGDWFTPQDADFSASVDPTTIKQAFEELIYLRSLNLKRPIIERFLQKVEKTEKCWNWIGTLNPDGYGQFTNGTQSIRAHRFSYEAFKDKIPFGLQLDHLCKNKACVNPSHLEPVTNAENQRRAMTTHCKQGHEFNAENSAQRKKQRVCLICNREWNRKHREKKRLERSHLARFNGKKEV